MAELLPPEESGYVRAPRSRRRPPQRVSVQPIPPLFPEQMATFVVDGGQPLSGTIRPAGNKNAALPAICAAVPVSYTHLTLPTNSRV